MSRSSSSCVLVCWALVYGSIVGCGGPAPAEEEAPAVMGVNLEPLAWELVDFGPEGPAVVVGSAPTIEFDPESGAIHGTSGCNRYRGSYQSSGADLSFGPAAGTMMACPEEGLAQQEQAFHERLAATMGFKRSGESLHLLDAAGARIMSLSPRMDTPLIGPEWSVLSYNNGDGGVVSVILGTEMTLSFGAESIAGSAGCNRFQASYEATGGSIEIGMAAATRKFCGEPEGTMEQEGAFLAALATAATFSIEGDRLDLRTAEGARVALLEARPTE